MIGTADNFEKPGLCPGIVLLLRSRWKNGEIFWIVIVESAAHPADTPIKNNNKINRIVFIFFSADDRKVCCVSSESASLQTF